MRTLMLLACILTLSAFSALAEGSPSLSNTPHLIIVLSDDQVAQIAKGHWIKLNERQTKIVQRLHPTFKGGVSVITSHFNDCSCGLGSFAMWNTRNTLAFSVEGSWGEYDEWADDAPNSSEEIYIDAHGKLWMHGKVASDKDVEQVCQAALKQANLEDNLEPYIFVHRPPRLDEKSEIALKAKIALLEKFMTERGVKLVGYGINLSLE